MAPRDPNKVQLDFPVLTADLIDELNLRGSLGLLDFVDAVSPIYIIGVRGGSLAVTTTQTSFASAEVFSGEADSPAAATVIADTGPLVAGTYDIMASLSVVGVAPIAGLAGFSIQHRNAANGATLATLLFAAITDGAVAAVTPQIPPIGYEIGLNERLRAITGPQATDGGVTATIWAALRPAP